MEKLTKENLTKLILNDKESFNDIKNDYTDLSEIDLSNASLSDIDFSAFDLSSASFNEANLTQVNFSNCDLSSSSFTRSNLIECDFTNSNLNDVNFNYSQIEYCNFQDADFSGTKLFGADLSNTDLSCALNLDGAKFDDSTLWPDLENLPLGFDGKLCLNNNDDFEENNNLDEDNY